MPRTEFVNASASSNGPTQDVPDSFVFVPVSSSEAAKRRGAAKSVVRAHVTRLQHARTAASRTHTILHWTVATDPPSWKELAPPETQGSVDVEAHLPKDDSEAEGSDEGASMGSLDLIVPPIPSGSTMEDPFWTYPVGYRPALSPIFSHYIQNIAVDIPDVDGPNDRGLLRTSWFPLAMTEPAPMYALLLMAASHYCIVSPSESGGVDLLSLKARALAEINAALRSPDRALSDAVIGAVAKMTAYEAIFGDLSSYKAHREGLQDMIKLRGGLSKLGLNGLLERMLIWIDLNSSHMKGLSVVFGGERFPTSVWISEPDLAHFAGIS